MRDGQFGIVLGGGNTYNLNYIITGPTPSSCVVADAQRLCRAPDLSERVCLVFAYGSLSSEAAEGFIEALEQEGTAADPPFEAELIEHHYSELEEGISMAILPCLITPREKPPVEDNATRLE